MVEPGDEVRIRGVLPVEWPSVASARSAAIGYAGAMGTIMEIGGGGLALVMLDSRAVGWVFSRPNSDGEPQIPCPVLPVSALEPVPPALPGGWRVYHGEGHTSLWYGSQGEVARVIGDRLVASLPAHLPYPDSVAAIAHLLAVAVPTVATGGELFAVVSGVDRG